MMVMWLAFGGETDGEDPADEGFEGGVIVVDGDDWWVRGCTRFERGEETDDGGQDGAVGRGHCVPFREREV